MRIVIALSVLLGIMTGTLPAMADIPPFDPNRPHGRPAPAPEPAEPAPTPAPSKEKKSSKSKEKAKDKQEKKDGTK